LRQSVHSWFDHSNNDLLGEEYKVRNPLLCDIFSVLCYFILFVSENSPRCSVLNHKILLGTLSSTIKFSSVFCPQPSSINSLHCDRRSSIPLPRHHEGV
jgi:hypothetical protein